MSVAADGDAELAAKSQVGNLQALLLSVNQQILWLEVAVHDAVLVAVRHPLDQLVHERLQAGRQTHLHQSLKTHLASQRLAFCH